ncbi:MAG: hypothetical protein DMF93_01150, partial [Acidobacteria bacterium]
MAAAAVTLAALAGATAPAAAQQITEARIRELIKEAVDPASRLQTPPTAQPGATGDTRPAVALTLDDAVKFALDRNLDIAVQRLNPEINDIAVASIASVYRPAVTSTVAAASQSTPANSAIAGSNTPGAPINTTTNTYNGGIAQNIPWGGGSAAITLNNNRGTTTSLNALYNP